MRVRRLSWAGTEIVAGDERLLIDAVNDVSRFRHLLGEPRWPAVAISATSIRPNALVTHQHLDHFDPDLLRTVTANGHVFCPAGMIDAARSAGLEAIEIKLWQTMQIGYFEVTAVPAVDWRGDDQVSWVIAYENRRLFHGGDTIWHGSWWNIKRFGSFDVAMLPVNGVVAEFPGIEPSHLPATLTPEQAVIAARLLKAAFLCPMHYRQFNNPPVYAEQGDIETRLRRSASAEGVEVRFVRDGEPVLG
jgi:L-ascorbate metabolism protein UlaG (beta-lactamase superfamily)